MEKPRTSWVIRIRNEQKWLGRVLQRLRDQTQQDFEIIIVDNESDDRSLDIARSYGVDRVVSIKRQDFGYSRALNLGIHKSRGEFIGIISGHSLLTSVDSYERAMSYFGSKVAAVTGYTLALPDASPAEKLLSLFSLQARVWTRHFVRWMTNTNAIIRRSCWEQYPFDESLREAEDIDWAMEMLARGWDVIKTPEFNVYHSHGGLGRPIFLQRLPGWRKIVVQLDKRERPRVLTGHSPEIVKRRRG